jgi:putative transposase
VAILDGASRRVLTWRLAHCLDSSFCVEALPEALARSGRPEIFNTDPGSPLTREVFTAGLQGIRIRLDGRGCGYDTLCIERLWRTVKDESLPLQTVETRTEWRQELQTWLGWYNPHRPHPGLSSQTPEEVYFRPTPPVTEAT